MHVAPIIVSQSMPLGALNGCSWLVVDCLASAASAAYDWAGDKLGALGDWLADKGEGFWDDLYDGIVDYVAKPSNWAKIGAVVGTCLVTGGGTCAAALVAQGLDVASDMVVDAAEGKAREALDTPDGRAHLKQRPEARRAAQSYADAVLHSPTYRDMLLVQAAVRQADELQRDYINRVTHEVNRQNERQLLALRSLRVAGFDWGPEDSWSPRLVRAWLTGGGENDPAAGLRAARAREAALMVARDARFTTTAVRALRALGHRNWGPEEAWFYEASREYALAAARRETPARCMAAADRAIQNAIVRHVRRGMPGATEAQVQRAAVAYVSGGGLTDAARGQAAAIATLSPSRPDAPPPQVAPSAQAGGGGMGLVVAGALAFAAWRYAR